MATSAAYNLMLLPSPFNEKQAAKQVQVCAAAAAAAVGGLMRNIRR